MIQLRAVQLWRVHTATLPAMSSVLRVCRKCRATVLADAPEGLCTACLFETGLNLLADPPVAGVVDPGRDGVTLLGSNKKC